MSINLAREPMEYIVKYETEDGDLCTVHVDAISEDDAEEVARSEYWDINEILMVYKA